MKTLPCLPAVACLVAVTASPASASLILPGLTADAAAIDESGNGTGLTVVNAGEDSLNSGRYDDPTNAPGGSNSSPVFVFQLPNFGAVADPFITATFTFNLEADTTGGYNHDLWGLDARAASTVLAADYQFGAVSGSSSETLLQGAILTANGGSTAGSYTSVDIAGYLNTQYNAGAGAGQYVFLRLSGTGNAAVFNNANNGAYITSADAASNQPFITYTATAVPEASEAIVFLLGMAGLVASRCR